MAVFGEDFLRKSPLLADMYSPFLMDLHLKGRFLLVSIGFYWKSISQCNVIWYTTTHRGNCRYVRCERRLLEQFRKSKLEDVNKHRSTPSAGKKANDSNAVKPKWALKLEPYFHFTQILDMKFSIPIVDILL